MPLLVYVTDKCNEDAKRYEYTTEIEKLQQSVESKQSVSQFDPFPGKYYVRKKLGGRQGRLIAELRSIDEHEVLVFNTILIRGDRDYVRGFAVDPEGYGERNFKDLVTSESLSAYVSERTKGDTVEAKSQPIATEYGFLYETFKYHTGASDDDIVYETEEWMEAIRDERISSQLNRFAGPCLEALQLDNGVHYLPLPERQNWGLWVQRLKGKLVLIIPVTESNQNDAELAKNHFLKQTFGCNHEKVLRLSRRAYPAYMLADEDTWLDVEKEPLANLALSPEESDVLLSVRQFDRAFPLFINGRAGSGKSTLLQYLFADLLFYYLSSHDARSMAPPIYLTINGELISNAHKFVSRVLRSEAIFRASSLQHIDNISDETRDAFKEFRPFLLSMITPSERNNSFHPKKRVDYSLFRQLWYEWFGHERAAAREYGPDISWHVIRSYIKGMQSEFHGDMDIDDYMQLPENQLTVTPETFELVYERVWKSRYSDIAKARGFWDDQDLARYILDNDLITVQHPAVICDEVQDFTRIELEILLRLNLFSDRCVEPHELTRIPFAFAGDQFQTLNPTGFRWDSVKASFVEKFVKSLDLGNRSNRTDLNYKELRYNYRSTPPIVRFCNTVQALRAALFGIPSLSPQIPWSHKQEVYPVFYFCSSDSSFWRKYKELVGTFIFIVPCNEGEERQYVEADSILSNHIQVEDGIPKNVVSVTRAKGLEYSGVVVVYGFGHEAPQDLLDLLPQICDNHENNANDDMLPLQYYINKLYVAVSRPKERLIIVDSATGFERLWRFATDDNLRAQILAAADNGRSVWMNSSLLTVETVSEGMILGNADDMTLDNTGNPIDNALIFEQDGMARKDPFLLKQAAMAYASLQRLNKSLECKAYALFFDSQFLDAGQIFWDAGLKPLAVRSFWRAGPKVGWARLADLYPVDAQVSRFTEVKIAHVLATSSSQPFEQFMDLISEFMARLKEPSFNVDAITDSTWGQAICHLAEEAMKARVGRCEGAIVSILIDAELAGVELDDLFMANLLFNAGSFKEAVKRFEKTGSTSSREYLASKAAVSTYPACLALFAQLDDWRNIVTQYEASIEHQLSEADRSLVADAYLTLGEVRKALDISLLGNASEIFLRTASVAHERGDRENTCHALRFYIFNNILSVDRQSWQSILDLFRYRGFGGAPSRKLIHNRDFIKIYEPYNCASLVEGICLLDDPADVPNSVLRQFSEILLEFIHSSDYFWFQYVSVKAFGHAIEKCGRFKDAISFYENLQSDSSFHAADIEFAKLRILVCRTRQLRHEFKKAGESIRYLQLKSELVDQHKQAGLEASDSLPEYPLVSEDDYTPLFLKPDRADSGHKLVPLLRSDALLASSLLAEVSTSESVVTDIKSGRVADQLPDLIQLDLTKLRVEFSRKARRCNISSKETLETIYIDVGGAVCGGELEWVECNSSTWKNEQWGLVVDLRDGRLSVAIPGDGLSILLDC